MSIEGLELDLIIDLVESMAVVIVVAYLFTRTKLYQQVLDHQLGRQGRLLLILIFGAFSVWGTLSGVDINGAIANTRDLGPALGGLIGGPIVGVGAGLIGGIAAPLDGRLHRRPVGARRGRRRRRRRRRLPALQAARRPRLGGHAARGLHRVRAHGPQPAHGASRSTMPSRWSGDVIVPMILVNAAGMGLFVFIVHNEERERLTAAQKERMEGELTVARDIQRSIVPMIFPPFPEREEFDLHASLEPAREVGGDLYDFFLLDDDHLCIAIGDVAGKGVPASLFMAVTITLLRAAGARSSDPAEVLARVNEPLCRGNDAAMFVTLFYGVYRVSTGELTYSTGGHLPPYVLRAGGGVEVAARTVGPGLGISPAATFGTAVLRLEPGDGLLLYTDGVSEAMDAHQRMFGTERIETVLRGASRRGRRAAHDRGGARVGGGVRGRSRAVRRHHHARLPAHRLRAAARPRRAPRPPPSGGHAKTASASSRVATMVKSPENPEISKTSPTNDGMAHSTILPSSFSSALRTLRNTRRPALETYSLPAKSATNLRAPPSMSARNSASTPDALVVSTLAGSVTTLTSPTVSTSMPSSRSRGAPVRCAG